MLYKEKSLKNVEFYENAFRYKGIQYSYDRIRHLKFEYIRTTQRVNFIKVGEPETTILELMVDHDLRLRITVDESTLFVGTNKNKQEVISRLADIFDFISKRTFKNRLKNYYVQFKDNQFFIYDNCQFHLGQVIIINKKSYNLSEMVVIKYPDRIELQKKNRTFLDKIIDSIIGRPSINTSIDRDVIFYLLEKLFGLKR